MELNVIKTFLPKSLLSLTNVRLMNTLTCKTEHAVDSRTNVF